MRVKILNRYWRLLFVATIAGDLGGQCDCPGTKRRAIRVLESLRGEKRLELIIHEILHAAAWDLAHDHVTNTAEHLAGVLWEWGWRVGGLDPCRRSGLARVIAHCLRLIDPAHEWDTNNWATQTADAIANVLWRLGYRLEPDL